MTRKRKGPYARREDREWLRTLRVGQTGEVLCLDQDEQKRTRACLHTAARRLGIRIMTTAERQWLGEDVKQNEGKWPLVVERIDV